MTRKRIFIFILMLVFFAAAFYLLFFNLLGAARPPQVYNISMIVRGKGSDSWTSMRQGAEQAASEMNVDLSFITLAEENAWQEQVSLLWRELDGGANAIILSCADYENLVKPVERIAEKAHVVCVESPVNSPAVLAYIGADDYDMGAQIAACIIENQKFDNSRVLVLQSSPYCENIRLRSLGLRETLENTGKAEIINIPVSGNIDESELHAKLKDNDILVALEPFSLEAAAQFLNDSGTGGVKLYGIGNSGKIASFLELNVIGAAVVQNDFGCGYLAVLSAVDALENRAASTKTTVEYRIIDSEKMYAPENQRLLFPFVR